MTLTSRQSITFFSVLISFLCLITVSTAFGQMSSPPSGDLLNLNGFNPTAIEIDRSSGRILLEKNGDDWYVVEPVDERADQDYVAQFIGRMTELTVADVLPAQDGDYGLTQPQVTVSFTDTAGTVKRLNIGDLRSPVSLFVQPEGDDVVYAVSNTSLTRIGARPIEFTDRNLFAVDPADVVRVTVGVVPVDEEDGADEVHHQVVRRGAVWMTDEDTVAFDVGAFLRSLRIVEAIGRVEGDLDVPADDLFYPVPGAVQGQLVLRSGETLSFDVGAVSEDGMYRYFRVPNRDRVYLVPAFHANLIYTQALGINDALVFVDFDFVDQIKVIQGPEKSEKETLFRRNADGQWESNRAIAFNFAPLLDAIGSIEAISAAAEDLTEDDFQFGVTPDAVRIELRFMDRNELHLQAGASTPDGSGVYVQSNEKEGVYIGNKDSLESVLEASEAVRTNLFPLVADEVMEIRVKQHGKPAAGQGEGEITEFVVLRSGDEWLRDGESIAGNAVQTLLNELGILSADELAEDPEDEDITRFFPGHSSTRLEITFNDGSVRSLDIGGTVSVGSGWFATTNFYVAVSDLADLTFVREQTINKITRAIDGLK